ncbi:MAG: hypothetical protein HY787_26695 [Deltaproteobacteria bacterium]|nr:hypothetical protein [Deltaproteobacteria bacterium]
MEIPKGFKMRIDPEDDYTHPVEEAKNFNESMYINLFDFSKKMGGWFRIGNRPNEGYAEMSCCVYLPDASVGFMYGRPNIPDNKELNAGGMRFAIIEPFKRLKLSYNGKVCLLKNPLEMADPKQAFRNNPIVDCQVNVDYTMTSPVYGGELIHEDGRPIELNAQESFARAHYEQHVGGSGFIKVGGREWAVEGFGLRDHSWGPRYWQNIFMYRWLPMSFDQDFAIMISVIETAKGQFRRSGVVQQGNEYHMIQDTTIESDWDENWYQTGMRVWAKTDQRDYEIEGKVLSLIPLRNLRKSPEGDVLQTRIAEGMTEYKCDGKIGYGMSEYLDQIIDGKPVGTDVA